MYSFGRVFSNLRDFYHDMNSATLTGAIDIVVVKQPDGSMVSSPFWVRFGKLGVLRTKEKLIEIKINDIPVDLVMHLGMGGEAFFPGFGPCKCWCCVKKLYIDFHTVSEKSKTGEITSNPVQNTSDSSVRYRKSSIPSYTGKTETNQESLTEKVTSPQTEKQTGKNIENLSSIRNTKQIQISLCGKLKNTREKPEFFDEYIINYEDFCENPEVINSNNLVVKIGSRYFARAVGIPYLFSIGLFGKPLTAESFGRLKRQHSARKFWFQWTNSTNDISDDDDHRDSDWSSSSADRIREECGDEMVLPYMIDEMNIMTPVNSDNEGNYSPESCSTTVSTSSCLTRESTSNFGSGDESDFVTVDINCSVRRLHLSSDQIKELNLNSGPNDITYTITTRYQGTTACHAKIYLWNYDDKIVVSDVDGTITRSDIFGHMLPLMGKEWTQPGIVCLYNKIVENGYKIIYCSARGIGLASRTRFFLEKVNQEGMNLPSGPILLSPSSLYMCLRREVIDKKPEEFKISCLKNILELFPLESHPFFSGFGNKQNDTVSYISIGIPDTRNFLVNHKARICNKSNQSWSFSYHELADKVNEIFPVVRKESDSQISLESHDDEFNSFSFWRHL